MALHSMTGFGQAESNSPAGTIRVEIRGVNNRYLDLQLRLPRAMTNLETKVKKRVNQSVSRGSVQVTVYWDKEAEEEKITWNRAATAELVGILTEIKETHGLAGDLTIGELLQHGDIIKTDTVSYDENALWRSVSPVLSNALSSFQESRAAEGAFIGRALAKMNTKLEKTVAQIEKRAPIRLKHHQAELQRRVENLAGSLVDEQRMVSEIAVMADKLDISEECTRLRAHIHTFIEGLQGSGPVGKRLGFLSQEMNREANTIGSKANDTQIAHKSVVLKEIIEQIREQIQNIE
ncbi:MAG: YicC family protein [Chitinivibrionales bacterium]|nr:YicC family protein [Chitinivibrionales bacterium]MBD3357428.1 YicC family protein [Chitinivibrionales bacterium]